MDTLSFGTTGLKYVLFSAAKFECFMLSSHEAINVEKGLYTNIFGVTASFNDVRKVSGDAFVNSFFDMASQLKRKHLDSSEIALLQCVSILMPGKHVLYLFNDIIAHSECSAGPRIITPGGLKPPHFRLAKPTQI